jgi:hypothetical protein
MAFKDKIYASIVTQTKIQPKDAQVAGHTAIQLIKSKMPTNVALTFQRMLDSEDGTVVWTMAQAAEIAQQTKAADKTFGSRVASISPPTPAPASVQVKPTIVPTQIVGPKTLVQRIRSLFLTN